MSGLANLDVGFPEPDEISLAELPEFRSLMGLGVERDLYFSARRRPI